MPLPNGQVKGERLDGPRPVYRPPERALKRSLGRVCHAATDLCGRDPYGPRATSGMSPRPTDAFREKYEVDYDRRKKEQQLHSSSRRGAERRKRRERGGDTRHDDDNFSACSEASVALYETPFPAGSPTNLVSLKYNYQDVQSSAGPNGLMHDKHSDGYARVPPEQNELYKKSVVGYTGRIPMWDSHHGAGQNFTRRKEACLRKYVTADGPHGSACRLDKAPRVDGKGQHLEERMHGIKSHLNGQRTTLSRTTIASTPFNVNDGVRNEGVSDHVQFFENFLCGVSGF